MGYAIDSVANVGNSEITRTFANPQAELPQIGETLSLSRVAEAALSSIGSLQNGFSQDVTPAMQPGDTVQATGAADPAKPPAGEQPVDSTALLAEQIAASTQVQAQLIKFVMASSISSSLGRNLNMFLRGQ